MMMKTKSSLWVLLLMILIMPLAAHSQCADIFKKGVALMEAKKYKSAISYFQKAKKCDVSLTKQCDEKIVECERYLKVIPPKPTPSYVITLDKQNMVFAAEETGAKSVKVISGADWECTSDADWCTVIKKNENSLSINCKINQTSAERTATIRVNNGKETENINVIQKGMDTILKFAPDLSFEFGKEGDEYVEIPLTCTVKYRVDNKPEWVTIHREDTELIIIKVEPLKRTEKFREGIFSIESLDGAQKDYVIIKQYRKLPKLVSETDESGEEVNKKSKGKKRKGIFNKK